MKRLLLLLLLILIAAAVLMLLRRWLLGGRAEQGPARFDVAGVAVWLLFLLPLPAAAAALVALARGQFVPFLGDTLGYGLLLGAALLIRRGLASAVSAGGRRRPLKTLGSVVAGLGTGLIAWLGIGHPPAIAVAFGLVALAGSLLTFGVDLAARRPRGIGEHAWTTLAEAGRAIAGIEQAARDIRQPELADRLERITALAREILARIEDDPRDLRRARKFLNVYLDGVQRVVEGYAKTHGRTDAPHLDQRFRHALVTVEDAFRDQRQVLLERDIEDLDVQIEVLTRQLEREGIL